LYLDRKLREGEKREAAKIKTSGFRLSCFGKDRLMENIVTEISPLLSSSPTILALVTALAAVGVVGLALYVVLRALMRGEK